MLSFAVYEQGQLAKNVDLEGAYIVGTDDVPLRADFNVEGGIIECSKRAAGPAGIALLWNVEGVGRVIVETIRVQERDRPYILQVELARGRLLRLIHKLEDWDFADSLEFKAQQQKIDAARDLIIEALKAGTPAEAAALADQSLSVAMQAGERLTQIQAKQLLTQRAESGVGTRRFFGCSVCLSPPNDLIQKRLTDAIDFVTLPLVWRDIEATEQAFNWRPLDGWVETLAKNKTPIHAAPLLSFSEQNVPAWLYLWEHDFDTLRDLAFEHVRRIMNRYGQYINAWTAISGVHATNCFTFNFEQLIELTRMSVSLAKQMSPRGTTLVEIVTPWGEYYAANQRTIPPLLYADMILQSGVPFDAFALRLQFGPGSQGTCLRDFFQISTMLDQFAKLGKPLHITAAEVPSQPPPKESLESGTFSGGSRSKPWSEEVQANWLENVVEVALSKPFVESVSWHNLTDYSGMQVPSGGLLRSDLTPKEAYKKFVALRPLVVPASTKAPPMQE